ncbi:MAG: lipopolysaccharide biosynthesis protein [Bryobacteraceae bacterium]
MRWARILSTYAGIQVVVQLVGFLSGILVVRSLAKADYAVYTVALSSLVILFTLSDLGIGNALLALGGKVWNDNLRLGQLIRTAFQLRLAYFSLGLLAFTAVLFSLSLRAGASLRAAIGIWVILSLSALLQMNYTISSTVPRLRADVTRLQALDLSAALLRLGLIAAASLTFISTAIVLVINGLGYGLQALFGWRWANAVIAPQARPTPADRKAILDLSRNEIPNALFYCVYGQASVIVISIFGHTKEIAEVGALGRLGAIFTILGSVLTTVVLPRFARVQLRRELIRKYIQVVCCYLAGGGALLFLAFLFPDQLVWVLGAKYKGLQSDVRYIVAASLLVSFIGLVFSLNAAKGWVGGLYYSIPVIVVCQFLAAAFLNLATVRGAVLFGTLPLTGGLLVMLPLAWRGIRRAPESVTS